MNFTSIIFLAFAMSTDAFAAAVGKGAALCKPPLKEALRTGIIFGSIETIMPLIGWSLGLVASQYLAQWDHWIAFTLLLCLGVHMIWAGFGEPEEEEEPKTSHSFWVLALTGIATSIDALAVGVTLAFVDVSIVETALAIGLATTLMVTIGVMLGHTIGAVIGKRAEILGGIVLIAVGAAVLFEHLSAGEASEMVSFFR
ncbi:manganese efflux pump MntP [Azomonas macrocytogenes]|uniref:Putative manganese efflux pump MntP n=1 Tax=Azomonas macrocytogenes TaxID=69962 RepID=A0A839T267_AZOMA|nr:manganese efflux pump MntP [Azomonas macrocytogenes]MBB3103198.1 putative Mn2+ efflux pump MntP [Azomonas macrocytogenes]